MYTNKSDLTVDRKNIQLMKQASPDDLAKEVEELRIEFDKLVAKEPDRYLFDRLVEFGSYVGDLRAYRLVRRKQAGWLPTYHAVLAARAMKFSKLKIKKI